MLSLINAKYSQIKKFMPILSKTHFSRVFPNFWKAVYVLQEFREEEAKTIRKRYLAYPILPKAKEVTFKIMNDIYPSNNVLHERFNWENNFVRKTLKL